jgi:hypothetical protein
MSMDSSMKFPAATGTNGDKVQLCPRLTTILQKLNLEEVEEDGEML